MSPLHSVIGGGDSASLSRLYLLRLHSSFQRSLLDPFSTRGGWLPGWRYFLLQSFPGEHKGVGVAGPLQLVSLRKLLRIASFQSRLATAHNPELSAIVRNNLAIILCLFHLETPTQLKSTAPPVPAPIKAGRYYLPWWSRGRYSTSLTFISSIHWPPPPMLSPPFWGSGSHFLVLCLCHPFQR